MPTYMTMGDEFAVNQLTAGAQSQVRITALAGGGYMATWLSNDPAQDGYGGAIKAQLFDAGMQPIGAEFLVNPAGLIATEQRADITALANGGFVVAWERDPSPGSNFIDIQRYDASGTKIGGIVSIASTSWGDNLRPAITALTGGGFVVAWDNADMRIDGSSAAAQAQIFDAAGVAVTGKFTLNTVTSGHQTDVAVTGTANGGFAAIWTSSVSTTPQNGSELRAQLFNALGGKIGGELIVAGNGTFKPHNAAVAELANGNLLMTWEVLGGSQISAQLFDAGGRRIGGTIAVNSTTGSHRDAIVENLAGGGFAVVWIGSDYPAPAGDLRVKAQMFDATGARIGDEIAVSGVIRNYALKADVAASADGSVTVTWDQPVGSGGDTNIRARSFALTLDVTVDGGSVAENTTAAATVHATSPFGGTIGYTITGGADAALFTVDAATGQVSFVARPNFEAPGDADADGIYDVVVTAATGGLTAARAIAVIVTDVAETPVITSHDGAADVLLTMVENGAAVTSVSARDDDGNTLSFAITAGADAALFTLDSASGALAFVGSPDFEVPTDADGDNVYEVTVAASDGELSAVQSFRIAVEDVAEGVVIFGTRAANIITPTVTIAGQPLPTVHGDELYGLDGVDTLDAGAGDDRIDGGAGNDKLYGDVGADALFGGAQNDKLFGGLGADRLTGGEGVDQFSFTTIEESKATAFDVVLDFSSAQGDRIALSAIDARVAPAGNQAFMFIGGGAFTGVAGQLRVEQSADGVIVMGDVNGDRAADLVILVAGVTALAKIDFVL